MSFSLKVKEELASVVPRARHCILAELGAILSVTARVDRCGQGEKRRYGIKVTAENRNIIRKCRLLINKAFHYEPEVCVRYNKETQNTIYFLTVTDPAQAVKILSAVRLMDPDGSVRQDLALVHTTGITNPCCKRAFLRGVFFAGGSVSDPEKSYHLEIVCSCYEKAAQITEVMKTFELSAHIVERRRYYVVYLKEGSQIVDMLNIMGAHISLMDFENVRIVKEMRNSINRQVNCETANLGKTINAAVKQIEDIRFIKDTVGLEQLNEGLCQIAKLRLDYPDIPLKNLGELSDPPVGKSGVNHRLRKLSEIAEALRAQYGDYQEAEKKND